MMDGLTDFGSDQMDKIKQMQQAKEELENPRESDRIRAIAEILTEIDHSQRAAVMDQRDRLDIDPDDGLEPIDRDERIDEILALVDAYTPGGPSLVKVWLARAAPDDLDVEDPAALTVYAGLSDEEWQTQIQTWAKSYRSASDWAGDHTDKDLADAHVFKKWGVRLPRFERLVVDFDRTRALRDLMAGPAEATEQGIIANTEAAE